MPIIGVMLLAWSAAWAQRADKVVGKWPAAPTGGQWTTLKNASPAAPERDPFILVNPTFKGRVAYAPTIVLPQFTGAQWYFVMHSIGSRRRLDKDASDAVTYKITANYKIHHPQFSPDGRYILFKDGETVNSWDSYDLYLWDTQKSTLTAVDGPLNKVSRWVRWSPDSRHIAYAVGGDASGIIDREIDRIALYDYDLTAGKSTLVARNPAVLNFQWSPQGTLLFDIVAGPNPQAEMDYPDLNAPNPRPDRIQPRRIYEWDSKTKTSRRLIESGFLPHPSRDGKEIAYLGWKETEAEGKRRITPTIYIYSGDEQGRKQVSDEWPNSMVWSKDSTQLITMRVPAFPQRKADWGMAYFKKISMTEGNSATPLGIVKVTSAPQINPFGISPDYESFLSKNGDRLFIKTSVGKSGDPHTQVITLQSIDLVTGHTNTEFELTNWRESLNGFAWMED